jgi:hypothetical protein
MTLYHDELGHGGHQSILERLFNKILSRGRSVVENAFGNFTQSFRELLDVIDLHTMFVHDAMVYCCLLHNVLLGQDPGEVARLLEILQHNGMILAINDDFQVDPVQEVEPILEFAWANEKRSELGIYFRQRHNLDSCRQSTLFPLKVLVPCEKCSWFKIVIMIFWMGWRSPTPLKLKIHCFLVGRIGCYSFYILLNLQLK